jgi:hypothetical protein
MDHICRNFCCVLFDYRRDCAVRMSFTKLFQAMVQEAMADKLLRQGLLSLFLFFLCQLVL